MFKVCHFVMNYPVSSISYLARYLEKSTMHESNLKDKAEKFSLSAAQHQSAGRPAAAFFFRPSSRAVRRGAVRRTSRRCYQNKVCLSLVTSQPPVCLTKFSHKKQPLCSWPESSKSKPPMAHQGLHII